MRKTEDPVEVGTTVENSCIPNLTYRLRNLEGIARRHDYEIRSLTAWSMLVVQTNRRAGPSAPPGSAELQREQACQGTASVKASASNALPCIGKNFLVPRLSQQSPFTVFHKKLSKPEEIDALSIQMFVARLTKNQETFLVRICPHLSARNAWNKAIATRDELARSQGHGSKCWRTSHRWDQTCARYPRARARARERRTTTTTDGTDDTTALAPSLQRRRHGAHAAGTTTSSSPLPRLAVLRGLHSSELFH